MKKGVGPIRKLLLLFTDAERAFDIIKKEKGVYLSLITYFLVLLITTTLMWAIRFLQSDANSLMDLTWGFFLQEGVMVFLVTLILPFVLAFIFHFFVFIFGGRGIANTWKIISYSMIPFLVLNLIPFVGSLSVIITLMLIGYGVSKVFGLSQFKSGLAVTIPVILFYGLSMLMGFYLVKMLGM